MRVLEEAQVCPAKNASVVRIQLDVDDLLVMGFCDCDGGGDSNFDWCVDGG